VSEDIEKIDLVLNSLLNYIKMSTPLNKSDTIQQTLEEVLRRHEDAFKTKGVKIFKKYEKGLPETVIPEVQLRYVLHSLMEYILSILPLRGSIGFLTKLVREAEETKETKGEGIRPVEERQRIEVLIVFTGFKRPSANYETIFGVLPTSPEEDEELELKLIHEIINRNKGRMVVEVNEKKPRTVISLRLPVERRRVIYYQTANI
jgi:nitrogen-specific signal transduction histidine kinase